MSAKVTGIRHGDVLKLDVPEDIPEGQRVELQLVRVLPKGTDEEREEARDIEAFVEAIRALQEEAARDPEWWDEFDRDRRRYPIVFPERDVPGDES